MLPSSVKFTDLGDSKFYSDRSTEAEAEEESAQQQHQQQQQQQQQQQPQQQCDNATESLPSWSFQRQESYVDADMPVCEFGDYLVAILDDDSDTIQSVLR